MGCGTALRVTSMPSMPSRNPGSTSACIASTIEQKSGYRIVEASKRRSVETLCENPLALGDQRRERQLGTQRPLRQFHAVVLLPQRQQLQQEGPAPRVAE